MTILKYGSWHSILKKYQLAIHFSQVYCKYFLAQVICVYMILCVYMYVCIYIICISLCI